jgi:hypothetical protein
MMPLKQRKILPPPLPCARQAKNPNRFFLPDSAGASAVPYEPCMTGIKGSNIGLSHRLGDASLPYPTIFDMPVSDGRQSRKSRALPFYETPNCHIATPTLRMDYRFSESCIL